MTPETRAWVRTLPLLLVASILLIFAAAAFWKSQHNSTASIASFATGLILMGAWLATAIADWQGDRLPTTAPHQYPDSEEEAGDAASSE